jgi:hypothetical protein
VGAIDVGRNGPTRRTGLTCCARARACGLNVAADRMGRRRMAPYSRLRSCAGARACSDSRSLDPGGATTRSASPRSPGGSSCEWSDKSPLLFAKSRFHAPLSGCSTVMGDQLPGVFASLDPRLISVTPVGVTDATASRYCAEARACGLNVAADRMGSRRMAPYSRLGASSVERVFQPVRPNGEGETACGYRANLSQEHAPIGATEISRGLSEATPPVTRPPTRTGTLKGCVKTLWARSTRADLGPRGEPD